LFFFVFSPSFLNLPGIGVTHAAILGRLPLACCALAQRLRYADAGVCPFRVSLFFVLFFAFFPFLGFQGTAATRATFMGNMVRGGVALGFRTRDSYSGSFLPALVLSVGRDVAVIFGGGRTLYRGVHHRKFVLKILPIS
jgi:hypothetical protein